MGYGIGNNLFDIRYLTDENANLKNEGWASMADPFYDGKQFYIKTTQVSWMMLFSIIAL